MSENRRVILANSFEGLPPPNEQAFPADANSIFHTYEDLAVSIEQVKRNIAKFGLLDEQVVFLKGWFKDTMPSAPVEKLAVIRLDGDMYEIDNRPAKPPMGKTLGRRLDCGR